MQSFQMGSIILSYQANKAYIADNFCVNKFEAELLCMGKCYLEEALIETTNTTEEQAPPVEQREITTPVWTCEFNKIDVSDQLATLKAMWSDHIDPFIQKEFSHSIFHPPQVV